MDQQNIQDRPRSVVRSVLGAGWRFFGRVGLAERNLLTWFIWIPLYFLTMPLWLPTAWIWNQFAPFLPSIWAFIGSVGLAIRKLWVWFIWEPFQWLMKPVVLVVKRIIWPSLGWIFSKVRQLWLYLWQKSAPKRHLWLRALRSRWLIGRMKIRLWVKRPSAPLNAEIAPVMPRPDIRNRRALRLATAFASVAVLLTVGIISLQERQLDTAVASADSSAGFNFPQFIILTPTPLPASPTPEPTVALTPWPTPDLTKGGGAILFSQHVQGNSDIYLLPVGHSEAVRVTSHPALDKDPVWSPDGSRIAFASNRDGQWDIFVLDIRLGRLQNMTNDRHFDGAPTWSPDGEWLAYESYQDDNLDIFLVKLAEPDNAIQLTRNKAHDYGPSWEPVNGRHIAFTSWRTGRQDIFIRSLDDPLGERVVNITQSPDKVEEGAAFSPDGRLLAYHVVENDFQLINGVALSDQMLPLGPPRNLGQQGAYPAWSPDNKALVYVFDREGQSFLVAGSPDAWGVTPQVFAAQGSLSSPAWTAIQFTADMVNSLSNIDQIEEHAPLYNETTSADSTALVNLFELPVNAPSPYLSDRVDQSFEALRQRLINEAGWDVLGRLDGMFSALTERPLPGQPEQNWNKAGRAFDLSYQEALSLDPRIELVQEQLGNEIYWRVFVKAAVQDGSLGEPLRALPWDFRARSGDDPQYYDEGGKVRNEIPVGYYVDFTAVAHDYGWERVPSGPNWKTYFPDIQFWHFENRQGLTWQEAMLEIYSADELSLDP